MRAPFSSSKLLDGTLEYKIGEDCRPIILYFLLSAQVPIVLSVSKIRNELNTVGMVRTLEIIKKGNCQTFI